MPDGPVTLRWMNLCENPLCRPKLIDRGSERPRRSLCRGRDGSRQARNLAEPITGVPLVRTPSLTHVRNVVVLLAVATATSPASAQTPDPGDQPLTARAIPFVQLPVDAPALAVPDSAARRAELDKWVRDFTKWKNWADTWGNRREPGWFSGARSRRPRPDPPLWLFDECDGLAANGGASEDACELLADWMGTPGVTPPPATISKATEDDDKITWWEHVHLDAGWPSIQSSLSLYGVLGMHATTTVKGRFQVFIAPGAMLLNVPTRDGGRAWKIATNYGIAYFLGRFTFPGTARQARLHLNIAKAWLLSAGPDVPTQSTDFVGLSITFSKTP